MSNEFLLGSGKTTLLSVITGDHPQSYTQSHLHIFGQPRRRLATTALQQRMGVVSPEIFNAFPRRVGGGIGLTVREAIATGFESTFSYRPRTQEQDYEIDEILNYFRSALGPLIGLDWRINDTVPFATLPIALQSLVLLLRALVGRPKLIILDEVFAGMDDQMVALSKQYLRNELGEDQAVIFVSHWEEEVPWGEGEIKRFKLGTQHN